LILSGPSGSGKTSCLKTLAKEEKIEILEWKELAKVRQASDDYGYDQGVVEKFKSFLSRAGMVPSLEFVNSPNHDEDNAHSPRIASTSSVTKSSSSGSSGSNRRLILVEDLPNVSHYSTKMKFRSILTEYLMSPRVDCPIVLIVSEALSRPGDDDNQRERGGGQDNLDSRSLCGLKILQHPACREIQFNPIAVTIMKKPLNRILDRLIERHLINKKPTTGMLDSIIKNSNGDIRSSLMTLQFISTQQDSSSSKGSKGKKQPKGENELLQFVTSRENSLFIFHALGKVFYNKRTYDSTVPSPSYSFSMVIDVYHAGPCDCYSHRLGRISS